MVPEMRRFGALTIEENSRWAPTSATTATASRRHGARLLACSRVSSGAPPADRGHAVRRRAADAGDGPRDDVAPEACCSSTSCRWARADDGAEGVRDQFRRSRVKASFHPADRENAKPGSRPPPRLRDGVGEITIEGRGEVAVARPEGGAALPGETPDRAALPRLRPARPGGCRRGAAVFGARGDEPKLLPSVVAIVIGAEPSGSRAMVPVADPGPLNVIGRIAGFSSTQRVPARADRGAVVASATPAARGGPAQERSWRSSSRRLVEWPSPRSLVWRGRGGRRRRGRRRSPGEGDRHLNMRGADQTRRC